LETPTTQHPLSADIAIIGAGAAGLMTAIFAGRTFKQLHGKPPALGQILLIDSAPKPGAKILVAGGGRCNVTHDVVHPQDYNTPKLNHVAMVLRSFPVEQTIAFFSEIGVQLKREETGKLFPVTDSARTVLDALLTAARQAGVTFHFGAKILAASHTPESGFLLTTDTGSISAQKLVLATGGKSLPKTGSDGTGYTLAKSLGHSLTHTFPALVPLTLTGEHWIKSLSGLTLDTTLSVALSTGKVIQRETGSTLLTHFGLSGPCPLNISRHLIHARRSDPNARLLINWLPGLTSSNQDPFTAIDADILLAAQHKPRQFAFAWLNQKLTGRLADALLMFEAKIPTDTPVCQISRDKRKAIAHALTNMPLSISGDRGFLFAEVTAGGVPLDEIKLQTMASRATPGLHLVGEILDVDGKIGGYNFQWAWASGRLAGQALINP
jgi:predicted Rossmann fold flavoprotein